MSSKAIKAILLTALADEQDAACNSNLIVSLASSIVYENDGCIFATSIKTLLVSVAKNAQVTRASGPGVFQNSPIQAIAALTRNT